ncbi:MAG: hypothetical protein FWE09_05190 [Treponema sp.]|nr:hypothetical protein [Treponema sp.]
MKKYLAALAFATLAILFFACDWVIYDDDSEEFASHLRGTWVANFVEGKPYGEGSVVIERSRIAITGFARTDNNVAPANIPFNDFIRNTRLEGFSEKDRLVIRNGPRGTAHIGYEWDERDKDLLLLIFAPGVDIVLEKK